MSATNSAIAEWRRYWTLPLAAALASPGLPRYAANGQAAAEAA